LTDSRLILLGSHIHNLQTGDENGGDNKLVYSYHDECESSQAQQAYTVLAKLAGY
jgi:hypothetical protein